MAENTVENAVQNPPTSTTVVVGPDGNPIPQAEQKPTPEQRLTAARVRVRKVGTQFRVEFPQGTTAPPNNMVRTYLPEKFRSRISADAWRYKAIDEIVDRALRDGIGTAQAWADAIGQALVEHTVSQDPEGFVAACGADPNLPLELAAGASSYLVVGGAMFKLTPTALVDKTTPLAALKKIARQKGEIEALTLITAGKKEAHMLIEKAETKLRDAERIKNEAGKELKYCIPEWGKDYIWMRGWLGEFPLRVRLRASFLPTVFYYEDGNKRYEWETVKNPKAFMYDFWLPVNPVTGKFSVGGAHLDTMFVDQGSLPHMTSSRLCGTVEGLPKEIVSYHDLEKVRRGIERAMNGINLASPLAWNDAFKKEVKALFPEPVQKFFAGTSVTEIYKDSIEQVAQAEVLKNTWNI